MNQAKMNGHRITRAKKAAIANGPEDSNNNITEDQTRSSQDIYSNSGSLYSNSGSSSNSSINNKEGNHRTRTFSTTRIEDHFITPSGKKVYTRGRPPWYDRTGKNMKNSYLIGICGGSASGKTTVAQSIVNKLEIPWVTILSMDSFYKVLNEDQHKLAAKHEYNFDHPDAFDFKLLHKTLIRLREGKSVEVPIYDFTTHRREKNSKVMYGADVLIFEGILSFHIPEIAKLMDIKIFVDTDSDIRLARRLQRDISERGRELAGVFEQYMRFVKPAFDSFILPAMKVADIIVPRGGENMRAIDLIVRQINNQLIERGYFERRNNQQRVELITSMPSVSLEYPSGFHMIPDQPQVRGLHTFIRDCKTKRDEFIFYSERLMRILIEYALNFVPYSDVAIKLPDGGGYLGRQKAADLCGISIFRAGETLEKSLRAVVKDCKMGKILIQTNLRTMEPELYYLRLPKNINKYKVFLMDATVATGAAAIMAIRILLDHDVKEENIILLSLLMAEPGVHSIAYAFPKVTLLTSAIDSQISDQFHILPGLGNFGDRYFGTDSVADDELEGDEDCSSHCDHFVN